MIRIALRCLCVAAILAAACLAPLRAGEEETAKTVDLQTALRFTADETAQFEMAIRATVFDNGNEDVNDMCIHYEVEVLDIENNRPVHYRMRPLKVKETRPSGKVREHEFDESETVYLQEDEYKNWTVTDEGSDTENAGLHALALPLSDETARFFFPDKPVAAGATWPLRAESLADYVNWFLDLAHLTDARVAVDGWTHEGKLEALTDESATVKLTLSGKTAPDEATNASFLVESAIVVRIDRTNGRMIDAVVDLKIDLDQPDVPREDRPFRFDAALTLKRLAD